MKRILFIVFLMLPKQLVFAQHKDTCHAGVYITKDDFINNRLSYKIDLGIKGNKFEFPAPADWIFTIKIIEAGSIHILKAGGVFGYNECGRVFRYSPGGELYAPEDFYRIEDDKHLVIYTSVFVGRDEFYYSVSLISPIHRLNMSNLEADFKGQPEFISAVRNMKKKEIEGDLAKRDAEGHFLINKIYDETLAK
jgi:hypothetical protein